MSADTTFLHLELLVTDWLSYEHVELVQVGDDEFGHMLSNILKDNGVDNSGVRYDHNARTALAFVTLKAADGEREFMFYRNPSADMLLTQSELDIDLIRRVCSWSY